MAGEKHAQFADWRAVTLSLSTHIDLRGKSCWLIVKHHVYIYFYSKIHSIRPEMCSISIEVIKLFYYKWMLNIIL